MQGRFKEFVPGTGLVASQPSSPATPLAHEQIDASTWDDGRSSRSYQVKPDKDISLTVHAKEFVPTSQDHSQLAGHYVSFSEANEWDSTNGSSHPPDDLVEVISRPDAHSF
jgi:hypothetical protein